MHCKHRINIFKGLTKGIVSGNIKDVEIVKSWVLNTDIETTINEVTHMEAELAKLKENFSAAKKNLARLMLGE
jgi:hypothetical protein